MSGTSFYSDGETYSTSLVSSGDKPGSTTPSQSPSSMYPSGGIYNALAEESATVTLFQQLLAQAQAQASAAAASASNASTSASNASASAAASAASASTAASGVQGFAGTATPLINGTAAVGTSTKWAHEDHVHPTDTTRAPVANPSFTGFIAGSGSAQILGNLQVGPGTTGAVSASLFLEGGSGAGGGSYIGYRKNGAARFYSGSVSAISGSGTSDDYGVYSNGYGYTATVGYSTGVWAFAVSPTAPTPTTGDSSTKLATTAFVQANNGVSSLGGTAGAITLNASDLALSGSALQLSAARRTQTTVTTKLSGSGSYTTPTGCTWIEVYCQGAGSGGWGSGTTAGSTPGSGGNTTFSTLSAGGATTSNAQYAAGAGGVASGGFLALGGANGGAGAGLPSMPGGPGGCSYSGSYGLNGTQAGTAGNQAGTNSGSGGGGGGSYTQAGQVSGAGGGAGAFCAGIFGPGTYSYAVGAGGTAGTAGTVGYAGGAGAAGYIYIVEHYN